MPLRVLSLGAIDALLKEILRDTQYLPIPAAARRLPLGRDDHSGARGQYLRRGLSGQHQVAANDKARLSVTKQAGKPTSSSETIYVGGVSYLKIGDRWQRGFMTAQDMVQMMQEKLKTHPDTCTRMSDQTAEGQAAAVYKVHNNDVDTDQVIRIFKSSGLMQGDIMSAPNGSLEMRYEYTGVQAPTGVK